MILILAWRNIWRNKVRSLVVIMSIVVGLWAGLFVMAFSFGMYRGHIHEVIRYQLSHVQVHHPRFSAEKDVRDSIPGAQSVYEMLRADARIKQVVQRSKGQGMVMSPGNSSGVMITGIDPSGENLITDLASFIEEGTYLPDSGGKQLLIGWKLAKKLKTGLKNKVVVMLQGADGEIVSGAFRIAGIFRTRNTGFDEANVMVRRSDFNELIGAGTIAHETAALLHSEEMAGDVKASLRAAFPGLAHETWRDLSPELDLIIGSFNQYMYIFIGIILLALMFGIINTQLMAVLERQREIGMLMAIGMNKTRLFFMIMMEAVFLALIGGPLGIVMSRLTIASLQNTGIDLSLFSEGLALHGFSNIIYPYLDSDRYLPVMIMTIGVAVLSAMYPAYKALRLHPSEAIRKI